MPDGASQLDLAATVARLAAELDSEAARLGVTRDRIEVELMRLRDAEGIPAFCPVTAADLLTMQIPQRQLALAPVLPLPGLAMMYAPRGMGKSFLALSIGYAIAGAGTALRWRAPTSRRVLYVDGEMPAGAIQARLAAIVRGAGHVPKEVDSLRFIASDLLPNGMPSIARPEVQAALDQVAQDADVLILDNLSTLAGGLRENEADDWEGLQRWLLSLRRAGKAALMIHHAGKGGQQRGTSRREDVLDTVIALRRPADYEASQGARFEVHLEKARGVTGADAEPFLAALMENEAKGLTWTTTGLTADQTIRAESLLREGMSVRDVAEEAGMSKSAVHRLKKRLDAEAKADGHA
jgi:putative DNA primase/helicase